MRSDKNSTPRAATERVVFLDWLRIYAFASVLAGHKFHEPVWQAAQSGPAGLQGPARLLWPFIEGGGTGVVVFFLISGYIITQVLQRERTPEFLLKRVLRIYPLYVTAVLLEHALHLYRGDGVDARTLVQQMLLLGDFFGTPYALAGVEWTLRLEIVFYLWMAGARAAGLTWANRAEQLTLAYVLLVLALHFWGPLASHTEWTRGYISLFLPFLLLGSVIWLYERHAVSVWTLLAFVLLTLVAYRWGLRVWQPRWLNGYIGVLGLALFVALWSARQWLPGPPWVLALSELTYAVYLTHNWLFDVFRDAALGARLGGTASALLALALLLATCWVLVRVVEQPAIRWARGLFARLRTTGAVTPPWRRAHARSASRTRPPASPQS